jgi:hypothetical protein
VVRRPDVASASPPIASGGIAPAEPGRTRSCTSYTLIAARAIDASAEPNQRAQTTGVAQGMSQLLVRQLLARPALRDPA